MEERASDPIPSDEEIQLSLGLVNDAEDDDPDTGEDE